MNKKRSFLVRFLGCGVMIALAGAMAFTCTVEPIKGKVILYHDVASTYDNDFWIIEAELMQDATGADKSIKKYAIDWDNIENSAVKNFWLEYKEGVEFKDLELYLNYYVKIKDYDSRTEQMLDLSSAVFYASNSDPIYVAYRYTNGGYVLVTGADAKPSYSLEFPITSVVAAGDKTAVVVKAAKDRKAPPVPAINVDLTVTEGAER